jgi:subtilisin family serine protease
VRRLPAFLVAALAAAAAHAPAAFGAEPTGRHLVLFERGTPSAEATRVLERAGARRAGPGEPRLGIRTVTAPPGALAALRRAEPVRAVVPEYRRDLRRDPNDPAWSSVERAPRTPSGTHLQWPLERERFPAAWSLTTGTGSLVAVIDSGVDGSHPELAGKIVYAEALGSPTGALTDEDGHGTHVSGLACATTDNGAGTASAGWDCKLAVFKAPLLRDEDVIRAMVAAADAGAEAVNMSFGGGEPTPAIDAAIDYAFARGVVLVASASNEPDADQGSPASQLQPGDAADLDSGRGLVVTAADFHDRRAGTGRGPQISLAAYGFFDLRDGPPGLLSTYPGAPTLREAALCMCRTQVAGENRYAYLQGTSMAAPQVAGAAALVGTVNPALSAGEKLRILKQTARRSGAWTAEVGWGILDAGAAVDAARRVDRTPPLSRARAPRRLRLSRSRSLRVRLSGHDPDGGGLLLPSGLRAYDVYSRRGRGRYRRVRRNIRGRTVAIRIARPGSYSLYTRAVDRAGNREPAPGRPDARVRVRR